MSDFDTFGSDISSALGVQPSISSNKYAEIDAQYDKKYGLPPGTLNTFSKIESNHNTKAYNDKNRNGTIDSGRFQANSANPTLDGNDPDKVGQFVSTLYKKFNGDMDKVAAGYNAGPNGNFDSPAVKKYVNNFNTAFNSSSGGTVAADSIGGGFNSLDIEKALNTNYISEASSKGPSVAPSTLKQQADSITSMASNAKLSTAVTAPTLGLGETALQMGTGLGASIVGGARGLASLALGQGVDKAVNDIKQTQQDYTYQPRTDAGKLVSQTVALPFAAAKAGSAYVGGGIGQAIGGDKGRLVGESIGEVAPDVAMALAGGRSMVGGKSMPLSEITKVEPTLVTKPRYKLNSDGSMAPVESQTPAANASAIRPVEQAKSVLQKDNPNLSPVELERHAESQSLPVPVQLTKGQGSGDVNAISLEQNSKGSNANIAQTLNSQNTALINNFSAIRTKLAPNVTESGADLGQNIVDAYKAKDAPLVADISAKYKALEDANGGNFPLDGKTFVSNTEAALDKALKSGSVPSDIQSTLNAFKNGRQMTFQDFETLRSDLADVARSSTNGREKGAAKIVRQQLEDMPLTPEAAQLKPLADAARQAVASRYKLIEHDPAYEAVINDGLPQGSPSPVADKFIKNYLVNGKSANVKSMVDNIGGDSANMQLIKAGMIDHLKSRSNIDLRTNTGNVSQSGLNKAIEEQGGKLNMILGEDANTINTLGNVARYTQEQPKGSYVNSSNNLNAVMGHVKNAGKVALNVKTGGLYGMVENVFNGAKRQKELDSLAAPVKLRDLGK